MRTKICSKNETDPDNCEKNELCTPQNEFDLMISQKRFVAPVEPGEGNYDPLTDCAASNLVGNNLYTYELSDYSAIQALIQILPPGSISSYHGLLRNPVFTKIGPGLSITNYTLFPHLFFPGTIKRSVGQEGNDVYIYTRGEGASLSQSIKYTNIIGGTIIFKYIDYKVMDAYENAVHEHGGDRSGGFAGGGGSSGGGGASGRF